MAFWKEEKQQKAYRKQAAVLRANTSAQKTQIAPSLSSRASIVMERWCLFSHLLGYYPARGVAPEAEGDLQ